MIKNEFKNDKNTMTTAAMLSFNRILNAANMKFYSTDENYLQLKELTHSLLNSFDNLQDQITYTKSAILILLSRLRRLAGFQLMGFITIANEMLLTMRSIKRGISAFCFAPSKDLEDLFRSENSLIKTLNIAYLRYLCKKNKNIYFLRQSLDCMVCVDRIENFLEVVKVYTNLPIQLRNNCISIFLYIIEGISASKHLPNIHKIVCSELVKIVYSHNYNDHYNSMILDTILHSRICTEFQMFERESFEEKLQLAFELFDTYASVDIKFLTIFHHALYCAIDDPDVVQEIVSEIVSRERDRSGITNN